ncbi:MAG TPA: flagellar protein [Clostridiales bacterium]|nr:flagellar protein [Clostridiales bacterium]
MNIKGRFPSIEQMSNQINVQKENKIKQNENSKISFNDILTKKQNLKATDDLTFSKHVNERLASRNIELTNSQIARLGNATNMADKKGIKESLVIVDDLAFIVNIKNKTVVTAMKDEDEKIFTNIDGAIII